ncbi:endonuclease/exonuclease/phosphatase family protein [Nocardioides dubius]|uniref:Endonuclease/exonuclease/phosphatase domain-containing protein n=1 Tax=Nocardioides dubius TaxID=317019 RepID=A0ABN1TRV9_9ACTN
MSRFAALVAVSALTLLAVAGQASSGGDRDVGDPRTPAGLRSGHEPLAAGADPAARSTPRVRVVNHNTDGFSSRPARWAAADWGGVAAITYQELCRGQVRALRKAGFRVVWTLAHATAPRCVEGNAIVTRHRFARTEVHRLFGLDGRIFSLVCADLRGAAVPALTVCTTHFPLDYNGSAPPSGRQNRVRAADEVRDILAAKIDAGRRVVLAGDLNDTPKSAPLDRFYRARGNGRFWEGDQRCGARRACRAMPVTTGDRRRVDYFFASTPGVDRLGGVSKRLMPRYDRSSHWVMRGSVRFAQLPG